jgi:hypothetical protein
MNYILVKLLNWKFTQEKSEPTPATQEPPWKQLICQFPTPEIFCKQAFAFSSASLYKCSYIYSIFKEIVE